MDDYLHSENKPDITLNYLSLVSDLLNEGRLTAQDADALSVKSRRADQVGWHPLELIGEEEVADASILWSDGSVKNRVRPINELIR